MLEVKHLSKSFTSGIVTKRRVEAVSDVSFRIPDGKTFGIVGNSGCGKSTIARMLLSLLRPDQGSIQIDGLDLLSADRKTARRLTRTIQMIFQHPESSLDPGKKIRASLLEPMKIHRMYDAPGRMERLLERLRLVDLSPELLSRYPHQLSGGEAQRVMIARALTLEPRILVLDEPTSMLDVSVQAQVMCLLKELQEKMGLSYLFISHDMDVVRWFCQDIAVMREGRFVEMGAVEEILSSPQDPFTRELLESFSIWQE